MLKQLSLLVLLSSMGCQSTGGSKKPSNAVVDKSPGPIIETAVDTKSSSSSEATPTKPGAIGSSEGTVSGVPDSSLNSDKKTIFLGEADPTKNTNLPFGLPSLTSGADSWIISRPQYVMSWNPKTKNINWVAWMMNTEQFGTIGRQGNFSVDPLLKEYIEGSSIKSVTTTDYTGSCFDRGHQVASNDRQATQEDNLATFYTTNIIPQTAFLNQIIWKKLEEEIRDWVSTAEHKNLWIIAGPIYKQTLSYMGPNADIAVPSANFKAVFSWESEMKDKPYLVKAVIMPNVLSQGTDPSTDSVRRCKEASGGGKVKGETTISQDVADYLSTLPAIEAAAQIKFPSSLRP
jgi:DNA/RNA endonuclease G (NUC1)